MKLSRVLLLSALALPILALSQSVRPPDSGTWDLGQPTFPWENTYSLNLHGQQAAIGGLIIVGPEALANGGGPLDVALDSTTWSGTQGGPTVHTGHVTVLSGTFTAPSIVGDNSIARATGDTYTGTHAFGGATVTGISRLDASDGSPAPALSVDSIGRIGIGTVPSSVLDVAGGVEIDQDSTYTSESSAALRISDSTRDTGLLLGADAAANIGYIQSMDPGTSYFTRPLVLNPNGGNVGIGTDTPTGRLSVVNNNSYVLMENIRNTFRSTGTSAYPDMLIIDADHSSTRAAVHVQGNGGAQEVLFVASAGNVGIGTTSPAGALDVVGTWSLIGGDTRADAVNKSFRLGMPQYLASEPPFVLMYGTASASDNAAYWGGGSSAGNAATLHRWYLGADNSTLTGSEVMRLDSTGLGIGTTTPSAKLDVVGDVKVSGTIQSVNAINVTSSGQTAVGKGEHWHLTQDSQTITCPTPFTGAIFDVTARDGDHAFEIEPHGSGQLWQIGTSAPSIVNDTLEIFNGKCRVFWDGAYWMVDGN